jgi:hypothetical protein
MERLSQLSEAASLKEVIRRINKLQHAVTNGQRVTIGPGLESYQGAGGTVISQMRMQTDFIRASSEPNAGTGTVTGLSTFFARINSYTALDEVDGLPVNQWYYDFTEVEKEPGGYETPQYVAFRRLPQSSMLGKNWTTKTNGRGGTCYNFRENQNYKDGIQGNGIDLDNADLPAGMAIQPCPVGEIVVMYQVPTTEGNEYWFDYPNAFDGSCE